MPELDCVVVGYNEGDFQDYRLMCERSGPTSPEWQIYRKEHLEIDGRPMPWMDVLSTLRNRATGRSDRYHVGEVFNLAGLYLTNFLRRHGIRTDAVSLFGAEQERLARLLAERPAVVAITTTFYVNILSVTPIVDFVRRHSPTSHIVVGGPLIDNLCLDGITDEVQDLFHGMGADSYVRESQGEHALTELCQAVLRGRPLEEVANLITCPKDDWVANRRRPEANDLDACAIDWQSFTPDQIGMTAQTRTARSCAFKCSFCDYPTRAGALTTASVDTVRRELRAMAELGVKNLVFVDDTFNVPPKRFKELCRMMIEEDLGLDWYSYFRCSNARDEETFDLAAQSGCRGVFLGIESGDADILANMNKLAQDSQYRAGIARLKERGITTFASIIVGFPGENERTMQNTIDFVNETGPTFWRAQPWWGNPRSPVYRNKEVYGIEGAAYDWSHATMNSKEAAAWCDKMFDRVTESVWLPLYDFDFWSLPYLEGKGLGVDELVPLLRTTQELMRERDGQHPDPTRLAVLHEQLAKDVAALDMAPRAFLVRSLMTSGVHTAVSAAARAHPRRAAVVTNDGELTYAELDELSDRLCAQLVRTGTAPRSVVGLHFARSAEQVVALLAVLKAGCAYLPLDPRHPAGRLRHMIAGSGAALTLTGPGLKPPRDWPVECPVTEVALPLPPADGTATHGIRPDDLAYVLCTSGTTGRPKAVEVTHANVLSLLRGLEATVLGGVGPARVAWNASACFDASVQQWVRLCRGDTLVLLDEDVRVDPAALVDDLVRHGVTDMDVVPSHLALLAGPLAAAGLSLRLLVGGEPVPPALWAELRRLERVQGLRAWNMYGPTECTVDATTAPVDAETPHLGVPLPDVRCHVLDAGLRPVPAGETGELFIAGPGVARGYRGLPGRTAAAFLPDPFAGDGGRMYRTGDLVRYDAQGRLEFVGRRDRQVKVRGHRVELGEVEAALASLPEVAGAAVVLRDDLPAGPGLAAYAVPAVGVSPAVEGPALRERLRALLPGHMVPAVVVLLDALPVGPHGKVDHGALPRPQLTAAAPETPECPLERDVARIWTRVLGGRHIAPADNFFDLGGDSLAVGRVLNRCRERFGVRLRTRALFENPTLHGFAAAVRHETERLSPPPSNEGIPPRD